MTLSFHKVMFSAEEILDMAADCESLEEFKVAFLDHAEARSRLTEAPLPPAREG